MYVPAEQVAHAVPETDWPAGQLVHVLAEPSELKDAPKTVAHDLQAVSVPETKNSPVPQQTGVPVGVQWRYGLTGVGQAVAWTPQVVKEAPCMWISTRPVYNSLTSVFVRTLSYSLMSSRDPYVREFVRHVAPSPPILMYGKRPLVVLGNWCIGDGVPHPEGH